MLFRCRPSFVVRAATQWRVLGLFVFVLLTCALDAAGWLGTFQCANEPAGVHSGPCSFVGLVLCVDQLCSVFASTLPRRSDRRKGFFVRHYGGCPSRAVAVFSLGRPSCRNSRCMCSTEEPASAGLSRQTWARPWALLQALCRRVAPRGATTTAAKGGDHNRPRTGDVAATVNVVAARLSSSK